LNLQVQVKPWMVNCSGGGVDEVIVMLAQRCWVVLVNLSRSEIGMVVKHGVEI
jgi:hypothetical protein